jgi:hypothetical protein
MGEMSTFRGAGKAREPGIYHHRRLVVAKAAQNSYFRGYGFQARRFAASRNDNVP